MEVRSTIQRIKYLFKYCYEGHDWAYIEIQSANGQFSNNCNYNSHHGDEYNDNYNYDKLKQYTDFINITKNITRYSCPPEGMYRLLKYGLYAIFRKIMRSAVHGENQHNAYFEKWKGDFIKNKNVETTLTENLN